MHQRKRIRPQAPGWGKGWSVIGGDAVDYEASLDFDRVILGRTTEPTASSLPQESLTQSAESEAPADRQAEALEPDHSEAASPVAGRRP
jgi:hypothetical protein